MELETEWSEFMLRWDGEVETGEEVELEVGTLLRLDMV